VATTDEQLTAAAAQPGRFARLGRLARRGAPRGDLPRDVLAARNAVGLVFIVNGFAFASWAARLPAIRDDLRLTPASLGLTLLAVSVGSVTMLPLAGGFVRRLGPARAVVVSAAVSMSGMFVVGLAPVVVVLAVGLMMLGAGVGVWDVAMNVEGAEVERRMGRDVMPRFHAGFSLGTVGGAGVSALAAATDVAVRVHLPAVAVVVFAGAVLAVRRFLPDAHAAVPAPSADGETDAVPGRGGLVAAWLERRTLLIGVLVLSMALAEGSANDWLALAVVDGYGAAHAVGAAAFGVFVTGMTAMRLAGPWLLARFDPVLVVRGSAALVMVGSVLVVAGAEAADGSRTAIALVPALIGGLIWGAGAALGFPMGMTAAATDPVHSAARVGVVSTIGYTAFIAGPPLLGTIGQHVGVARSLLAVSIAVMLALVTAGAVRR
jgi:Na+/melibiose symporter-like transporter